MSGSKLAYAATRRARERVACAGELRYAPTPCPVLTYCTVLSAFTISGIDIPHRAVRLRDARCLGSQAWYKALSTYALAIPGTDAAKGAIGLRASYVMPGTEAGYVCTRGVQREGRP
eukprot:755054-Rhodomonas_salina.8